MAAQGVISLAWSSLGRISEANSERQSKRVSLPFAQPIVRAMTPSSQPTPGANPAPNKIAYMQLGDNRRISTSVTTKPLALPGGPAAMDDTEIY